MSVADVEIFALFRLQETAKRLRENRKKTLEKWEETTKEFDLFLSAAERDIRSSDSIGDDFATVKKQNEEFKVCRVQFAYKYIYPSLCIHNCFSFFVFFFLFFFSSFFFLFPLVLTTLPYVTDCHVEGSKPKAQSLRVWSVYR